MTLELCSSELIFLTAFNLLTLFVNIGCVGFGLKILTEFFKERSQRQRKAEEFPPPDEALIKRSIEKATKG